MRIFLAVLFLISAALGQEKLTSQKDRDLYDLLRKDLNAFAGDVTRNAPSELGQARMIVRWLAEHLEWKATDYQQRTVPEIINRGGGNCNELAMVAVAAMKEIDIRMRRVREINIHKETPARGETARAKVKEKGNRLSVFGRHHNDHVWIEIYDSKEKEWYPADPSIGVVGTKEWLEARAGFGKRFTLDPISEDMIVPFAIVAADEKGAFSINRSQHYMVEEFGRLYPGRLDNLHAWGDWVRLLDELDDKAIGAFNGEVNLHDYEKTIDSLAEVYSELRSEYLRK